MPFSHFGLHTDLLRGVREMGFTRPTPIQADTIPPALEGRDVLACAMTGSGKTAAFLLPILHHLLAKKRGTTRALVITPTRELAAQIDEHAKELAVHTPLTSAAIFGGVAMGPQEHALRAGADLIVATPGRLLDHFRFPYARLDHLEVLVLDEADRMLDMGFLPDIRRVLKHLPSKRQTLFFSATMPPPIAELSREMLKNPFTVNLERKAAPAVGITQAVYPGVAEPEGAPAPRAPQARGHQERARLHADQAPREPPRRDAREEGRLRASASTETAARRSGRRRWRASRKARYQVLVATDIAARGIDVEALSHVVNFDVPNVPEDYIHRVGRTARAEMTGDAFTFVSPEETTDLAAIERAIGKRLPRITVPGFDYTKAPAERFEVPIADRIAAIRARKAEERQRAPGEGRAPDGPRSRESAPGYSRKRRVPPDPQLRARGTPAGAGHGPSACDARRWGRRSTRRLGMIFRRLSPRNASARRVRVPSLRSG